MDKLSTLNLEPDPMHDVDLEGGYFRKTSRADLERAFEQFFASNSSHLCVFFHGGLVSWQDGLMAANKLIDGYTEAGAYPFFFIWHSDFLTALREHLSTYNDNPAFAKAVNLCVSTVARKIGATTVALRAKRSKPIDAKPGTSTDLRGLAKYAAGYDRLWSRAEGLQLSVTKTELDRFENALSKIGRTHGGKLGLFSPRRIRGKDNPLARVIRRLNSKHDHGLYTTVIEEILIALGVAENVGIPLWGQMKQDIDSAFTSNIKAGGAAFISLLQGAWRKRPKMRATLIGHSAGAIYVQRFIEALDEAAGKQLQQKVEVITLAAAVSFGRMAEGLGSLQRRISGLRMFGLSDKREGGYWEVPFIYNKSLLYIVSSLCEDDPDADRPIVGMARYWTSKPPYNEPIINSIATYIDRRTVWSPTTTSAGPGFQCDAKEHGGFPEDPETKASVCFILRKGF